MPDFPEIFEIVENPKMGAAILRQIVMENKALDISFSKL